MPASFMDKVPLPSLKLYSAGSVVLVSAAVYYALKVTSEPNWRANMTAASEVDIGEGSAAETPLPLALDPVDYPRNVSEHLADVMTFMIQEPLCMWTLINLAYCSLAVFGFAVQRAVFGQLRVVEAQRVKDKFWNYVFYKFIFVFGVVNVQYMDEVLLWCSWFTVLGMMHIFAKLAKDRFEYLSSVSSGSGGGGGWAQARLAALLGGVGAAAVVLLAGAVAAPASADTRLFLAAECALAGAAALRGGARLWLAWRGAEPGSPLAHYTRLALDVAALGGELAHVVHMLAYTNMLASMASLVLLMQLRQLAHALQARVARHRRWAARSRRVAASCPAASAAEVARHGDKCAICWEPMREARRLPCRHLFHSGCLCRWVQHDASCPTCRRALQDPPPSTTPATSATTPAPTPGPARARSDRLFRFDGSRYASWLPSFSVEVTRVRPPSPSLPPTAPTVADDDDTLAHTHLHAHDALFNTQDSETETMAEETLPSPSPAPAPRLVSVAVDTLDHFSEEWCQFGVSAEQREARLAARKRRLVAAARAAYLARARPAPAAASASASASAPPAPPAPS